MAVCCTANTLTGIAKRIQHSRPRPAAHRFLNELHCDRLHAQPAGFRSRQPACPQKDGHLPAVVPSISFSSSLFLTLFLSSLRA